MAQHYRSTTLQRGIGNTAIAWGSVCGHAAGWNPVPPSGFVYVATMTGSENEDYPLVTVDFVDDAVVACSYPPLAGSADELDSFGRSWIS